MYYIFLMIIIIIIIRVIYKWKSRITNIKSKPNIINLGLSRTGTSSMSEALSILGNETWHFTTKSITEMNKLGYNSIGDLPNYRRIFSNVDIDKNTKYILTTRESKKWKQSFKKWIYDIWNISIDNPYKQKIINNEYKIGDNFFKKSPINYINNIVHDIRHEYPEIYTNKLDDIITNHEKKIIEIFEKENNLNNLLIIDITDKSLNSEDKWNKICKFLNIKDIPNVEFPNKTYDSIYLNQLLNIL